MKGDKKYLVIVLLLLLIAVTFGTYAIYKSSATGSTSVDAAAWVVKVNNTNIVTSSTHTFDLGTVTWASSDHVTSGKIAPGSTGTVTLTLDATGTDVSLDYAVSIKSVKVNNVEIQNVPISVSGSNLTGTILVSASNKEISIPLTLTWAGATTDTDEKNATDLTMQGKSITIEVEVAATQKLS